MSFRIDYPAYKNFEILCKSNGIDISDVMRKAVHDYINNKIDLFISDYEIEKASEDYEFGASISFEDGAKWYRKQICKNL